jgi:hypothetical protein
LNKNLLPLVDLTGGVFLAPNAPDIYNSTGGLNWENSTFGNPFGDLQNRSNNQTKNLISGLLLSYEFIPGLSIKSNFGYNNMQLNETHIQTFAAVDPSLNDPSSSRSNSFASSQFDSWIIEPQITFNKIIGKHSADILVGSTFQEQANQDMRNGVSGFPSDALIANISGATNKGNPTASFLEYKYNAVFARLGYNYDQKFVINLTARRDGSSRFGPGKQFGNFGAVGAAWIISKEKWFVGVLNVLSHAKLRGSIGTTGNDKLSDYEFMSTYA